MSNQPPNTAAVKPRMAPSEKDSAVASTAMKMRGAGAVDHARQQIAAEIVGAQPMRRRHRLPDVADDLADGRRARSTARRSPPARTAPSAPGRSARGMGMRLMSSMPPPSLRMPEPRIGDDRRYVRDDVEADIDGGEDQADRLHHRHVALGDVVDQILPHARDRRRSPRPRRRRRSR